MVRLWASLNLDDPGAMVAVAATPEQVQNLIQPFGSELIISNYNSHKQTVVSGTTESINKFLALCSKKVVRCQSLPVSHAFHSDIVAPAAKEFRKMLDNVSFNSISLNMISTSTGVTVEKNSDLREMLGDQIRQPVRFIDAVLKATTFAPSICVEVGSGGILTKLTRDTVDAGVECIPTDMDGEDGFSLLNKLLARAFVLGFPLKLKKLFTHRFCRPFSIDNYNPTLIVNPCERPVEDIDIKADLPVGSFPPQILPNVAEQSGFEDYLAHRGEFIKDLITVDYRHYKDEQKTDVSTEAPAIKIKPEVSENLPQPIAGKKLVEDDSLIDFTIDWIAHRTGFPKESILPDMKLRDDLNLDSIKVGELAVMLNMKLDQVLSVDPAMFSNVKIYEMIDVFESEAKKGYKSEEKQRNASKISQSLVEGIEDWVRTFKMIAVSVPLEDEKLLPLPEKGTAVIVADEGCTRAKETCKSLKGCGFDTIVTDVESLVQGGDPPSDMSVLVMLLPEVERDFFNCTPSEFNDRVEGFASELFRVFQWAINGKGSEWSGFRTLILRPASESDDRGRDLDSGAAFLKTLCLEYPDISCKWITLPASWSEEKWADITLRELQAWGNRVDFSYTEDGVRKTQVARPFSQTNGERPNLGPDDVFIVTGGAKGITCELALGLAHETGVKLALVGSSPEPEVDASPDDNEIVRNLKRFKDEGIDHIYVQCDVTDIKSVKSAVDKAESKLGRLTGILHGAGISILSPFHEMDMKNYLRCIRIKARGLYNLASSIPSEQLKAVHLISSVLGKTGMRGQADYTFANAWLDGALHSIAQSNPNIHCLSLGYSVWSETGLVGKLETLDYLKYVGISVINTKNGVESHTNLIKNNHSHSIYVVTGKLTADLNANLYGSYSEQQGRFLEQTHRYIPGTELVSDAILSFETDLYLPEHVFEGTPIFPGVMAIEAMAQAAMACTERNDLSIIRNITFHRPLIVPEDSKVTIRTLALADQADDNIVKVRVAIRSENDKFKSNHFEAEFLFGVTPDNDLPSFKIIPETLDKDPDDLWPVPLFQGKFFRRITAIRQQDMEKESMTDIQVPEGARYYSRLFDQTTATPSPAVRDAFLQTGAIILPPGCLPARIGQICFYKKLAPGSQLIVKGIVKKGGVHNSWWICLHLLLTVKWWKP